MSVSASACLPIDQEPCQIFLPGKWIKPFKTSWFPCFWFCRNFDTRQGLPALGKKDLLRLHRTMAEGGHDSFPCLLLDGTQKAVKPDSTRSNFEGLSTNGWRGFHPL